MSSYDAAAAEGRTNATFDARAMKAASQFVASKADELRNEGLAVRDALRGARVKPVKLLNELTAPRLWSLPLSDDEFIERLYLLRNGEWWGGRLSPLPFQLSRAATPAEVAQHFNPDGTMRPDARFETTMHPITVTPNGLMVRSTPLRDLLRFAVAQVARGGA
jgi:hypothetical protein